MGNTSRAGTAGESKSRILNTIVLVLILTAIAIAPSQYSFGGRGGIPYITPADVIIALAFVVWVVDLIAFRRFRSLRFLPEPALYVAWAIVVSLIAVKRGMLPDLTESSASGIIGFMRRLLAHPSLKETIQIAAYFVITPLLLADTFKTSGRLRVAGYAFMGGGAAVIALGLIQGLKAPLFEPGGPASAHAIRALFDNNHMLSAYLAMFVPMCVAVIFFWPNLWMKILAGLLAAASVVLSFSGGSILALTVSSLAVAAIRGRRHVGYIVFAALVMFSVTFSLLPRGRDSQIFNSVSIYTKWGKEAIVSYRYRRWQSGLNIFRAHPITGVGYGMFQEHVGKQEYHMLDDGQTPTPTPPEDVTISKKFVDNRYILTAAETGLPGLLLLMTILFLGYRRALFAASDATDPSLKAILAGCFGVVVAASVGMIFTDFLVRGLALPLVFAISVPVWWAAERD